MFRQLLGGGAGSSAMANRLGEEVDTRVQMRPAWEKPSQKRFAGVAGGGRQGLRCGERAGVIDSLRPLFAVLGSRSQSRRSAPFCSPAYVSSCRCAAGTSQPSAECNTADRPASPKPQRQRSNARYA